MKPTRPLPISRGAIYRTPSGPVRATLDLRGDWFGRLVTPTGEGEPVTPIPSDSPLVRAYEPTRAADGEVADPVQEVRK